MKGYIFSSPDDNESTAVLIINDSHEDFFGQPCDKYGETEGVEELRAQLCEYEFDFVVCNQDYVWETIQMSTQVKIPGGFCCHEFKKDNGPVTIEISCLGNKCAGPDTVLETLWRIYK